MPSIAVCIANAKALLNLRRGSALLLVAVIAVGDVGVRAISATRVALHIADGPGATFVSEGFGGEYFVGRRRGYALYISSADGPQFYTCEGPGLLRSVTCINSPKLRTTPVRLKIEWINFPVGVFWGSGRYPFRVAVNEEVVVDRRPRDILAWEMWKQIGLLLVVSGIYCLIWFLARSCVNKTKCA